MTLISANYTLIGRYANVIIMNERINGAARKNVSMSWVPSERANASIVLIFKSSNLGKLIGVPQVHLFVWGAYSQNVAGSLHPGNRSYYFTIILRIEYLLYIPGISVPKVHSLSKAHGKNIILTPIEKIEVVVINDVRSIEYLFWELRDASKCLLLFLCFFLSKRLN